eukprot:8825384-Alexandrium_andersonii.AAC.1
MKHALSALRKPATPPLAFVRGTNGQVGVTTQQVDDIMIEAWQRVYAGNGELLEVASSFMIKHADVVVRRPTVELPPLTPQAVATALRRNARTAA